MKNITELVRFLQIQKKCLKFIRQLQGGQGRRVKATANCGSWQNSWFELCQCGSDNVPFLWPGGRNGKIFYFYKPFWLLLMREKKKCPGMTEQAWGAIALCMHTIFFRPWAPEFPGGSGRMNDSHGRDDRTNEELLPSPWEAYVGYFVFESDGNIQWLWRGTQKHHLELFWVPWWCIEVFSMWLCVKDSNGCDSHTGKPFKTAPCTVQVLWKPESLSDHIQISREKVTRRQKWHRTFQWLETETVARLFTCTNDNWLNHVVRCTRYAFIHRCW